MWNLNQWPRCKKLINCLLHESHWLTNYWAAKLTNYIKCYIKVSPAPLKQPHTSDFLLLQELNVSLASADYQTYQSSASAVSRLFFCWTTAAHHSEIKTYCSSEVELWLLVLSVSTIITTRTSGYGSTSQPTNQPQWFNSIAPVWRLAVLPAALHFCTKPTCHATSLM